MEGRERNLDTTGETPSKAQEGLRNLSHQADITKVPTEATSALFRYCMCWCTHVVIRHIRLCLVTFRILPSTLVTCPLAAYGGSISSWYYVNVLVQTYLTTFYYYKLLILCAWERVTLVCLCVCYRAMSYAICKSNIPMEHTQFFWTHGFCKNSFV